MRNHDGTAQERRGRTSVLARLGAGVVAGLAAVLLVSSAASAHVKVGGDIPQGGGGVITFRAPTESATARTVGLRVTFPAGTPVVSASTQPMAGWTSTVTTKKLARPVKTQDGTVDTYVAQILWKADTVSDGVPPGQFQMFNVSVYGMPETPSVTFPALQYYSDGTTVDWNEIAEGGAVPQHPAPVLTLLPPASATPAPGVSGAPTVTAARAASGAAAGPAWTGPVGMGAGIAALIVAVIALARTFRHSSRGS